MNITNSTNSTNFNKKNIQLNNSRDETFEFSNKKKYINSSSNLFTLKLNSSNEVITLPQCVSDFIEVAEALINSYMNLESTKYNVKHMSINKLKSNEMLLDLGDNKTRCIIEVSHNGLEIVYKLFTYYDKHTEYLLEKKNVREAEKLVNNYLIKLN